MFLLNFILQASDTAVEKGQWVIETWQLGVGVILSIIATVLFLKANIPQRLASGWKDVSEMEKRQREALKEDLEKEKATNTLLQVQIVDLTREVDVRREINRQDTSTIANLKVELIRAEESLRNAREQVKLLEEGAAKRP